MQLRCAALLLAALPLWAQQPASDTIKIGDVAIYGSLRTRGQFWDWFGGKADNQYDYSESLFRFGFSQKKHFFGWNLELAAPVLLHLPSDAVAAGTQGQLGFGGTYYIANRKSTSAALVFPKQGYLTFDFGPPKVKESLRVGRTEFSDGAEAMPKNATLSAVVKTRVAERLIGNFGFSDVGRSFDGIVYSASSDTRNVTLMGSRPTRGVFQVDGWGEINVNLFYGAFTQQLGNAKNAGEFRAFAIGYEDTRNATQKTDNRPAAAKAADHQDIQIGTYGADYVHASETSAGTFDLLLWGVLQYGSWGTQKDRAYAYVAEAGWQPPALARLKPWVRGGYDYGSGDNNPNDHTHSTFFQILPTARVFARFPLYNMMNNRDTFGELILRPLKKLTVRGDIHSLALASNKDLWYQGGGAYQPWTFGFTGRPSNNQNGLGTLFDISGDYIVNTHLNFGLYYAHVTGKLVAQTNYPADKDANLGFIELNLKF
jgi:Alginate export